MLLKSAKIRNFRLLADVELVLEAKSTVIVGRNNSGKTSLSEVMRRFLKEGTPRFLLEDFSSACYDQFCAALEAFHAGEEEEAVRRKLPTIELRLVCTYDPKSPGLGPLAPFVIDLDPDSSTAIVILLYELEDGGIKSFFADSPAPPLNAQTRLAYFKLLRDRILKQFKTNVWAEDPNDSTNKREISISALRHLVKTGFPTRKAEGFERNRNLFYVACSRPKKRLALLFTQQLSPDAMNTLTKWFGADALVALDEFG